MRLLLPALALCTLAVTAPPASGADRVKTANGVVESTAPPKEGVRSFKGRSKTMQAYFVNFIKTGNPNGQGLPDWPAYRPDTNYQRMRIDVKSQAEPEAHRDRYVALDSVIGR
jgi:carboxylesterase type B